MQTLFGYAVLRDRESERWAICRIEVRYEESPGKAHQYIEVIDHHDSIGLARYWATMLNEGKETEESVRQKIKEAESLGPRRR